MGKLGTCDTFYEQIATVALSASLISSEIKLLGTLKYFCPQCKYAFNTAANQKYLSHPKLETAP